MGMIGLLLQTVWVSEEGLETRLINGAIEANEISSIPKLFPMKDVWVFVIDKIAVVEVPEFQVE